MSKLNVAVEIARRWTWDLGHCPGTGHLIQAICEWKEGVELAPRDK